jgi:hypothetical protein
MPAIVITLVAVFVIAIIAGYIVSLLERAPFLGSFFKLALQGLVIIVAILLCLSKLGLWHGFGSLGH